MENLTMKRDALYEIMNVQEFGLEVVGFMVCRKMKLSYFKILGSAFYAYSQWMGNCLARRSIIETIGSHIAKASPMFVCFWRSSVCLQFCCCEWKQMWKLYKYSY